MITPVKTFSADLNKLINKYNTLWEGAYSIAGFPNENEQFNRLLKQIMIVKKKIDIILETEPHDEIKCTYINEKINNDLTDLEFFQNLGNCQTIYKHRRK